MRPVEISEFLRAPVAKRETSEAECTQMRFQVSLP